MSKKLDFKISSGLKNIIGKELITSDRIAIFELVKNSYDANANNVKIVFLNIGAHSKSSKILIIDNGDGMSDKDLEGKWLFVGYSEKKNQEKELNQQDYRNKMKKRIFAGAKGVGRFSCDRLGSKLKIYTRKKNEKVIHCLEVDWTQFEKDQEKEFQTIDVNYSTVSSVSLEGHTNKNFNHGTILEISDLNDKWDTEKLRDLKKYLQRLINPSKEKDKDFSINLEAKEFLEKDKKLKDEEGYDRINGPVKNIVFEKLNIKTTHIKCHVSASKIHTELIDKGKFIFSLEEKNDYPNLEQIDISVFYLNTAAKTSFTRIMGVEPKSYGSIFLYKNSFRIHPYGDEGNDWLGLETRKGQGYARYLASRELLGRIEVYGSQSQFKEVSSRDGGVVKSAAYDQLNELFIEKVLRRLERYVIEGINWDKPEEPKTIDEINRDSLDLIQKLTGQIKDPDKNIKFNPNLLSIFKEKQIEKLPEIIKNVEFLKDYVKTDEEKKYIDRQLSSVRLVAKDLVIAKEEKENELKVTEKESLFLKKVISTDKDIIINLNHQIDNSTQTIKEIILDVNKKIQNNSPVSEIAPFIDELSMENEKIRVLANVVDLANFNTKVEAITSDVILYIKEYLERIVKAELLEFKFYGANQEFKAKFKPLEISIILDNFISNSKKAGASMMSVKFKPVNNKKLNLYFADNGKGIDDKIKNDIFKRGYTTTKGSGIGLHFVKSIIEKMGGKINFVGNNFDGLGKGACFEVILL